MLDATFHYMEGHQYEGMDLKPHLRNDAQYLDPDQVKQERSAKAAIFASVKEVRGDCYIRIEMLGQQVPPRILDGWSHHAVCPQVQS